MDFLPNWPLESNVLLFFGFLLFCGSIGGYLAHRWPWLPSITGFMLVGFIAGPNVLHLVSHEALAQSRVIIDVALGLILYRLGLSLDIKALATDRSVLAIALVESTLTFVLVYYGLAYVGINGLPAAVISAIAISSSPAVLIHVAHELGAAGPVTERTKSLLALNNVIAFAVFSALLPGLYTESGSSMGTTIMAPLYQFFGSAALGATVGFALHHAARHTKHASQYQLALVVGAVTLTLGGSMLLKLSPLFAPLVLGAVVRSIERQNLIADIEFGPPFELFFIVLFVNAGAGLHIAEMINYAAAAGVFLLCRAVAKCVGVTVTGLAFKLPARQALTTGPLLLPMAGLAIGLVNTMTDLFPKEAAIVGSVVLAAVAVLETIGPPIASRALRSSGDAMGVHSNSSVAGHAVAEDAAPSATATAPISTADGAAAAATAPVHPS
jgi:Kef-type K+ transport system membrane component KefB